MARKREWTTVRADIETLHRLRRLAEATDRSVPTTLRRLVLEAERKMTEEQEEREMAYASEAERHDD